MKTTKEISRRNFLAGTASVVGSTLLPSLSTTSLAQTSGGVNTKGSRKVLHIIGYSHIDAAWLWPWRDGSDEALNTFRSALDRMKETPGFCYSHSSSAHYR